MSELVDMVIIFMVFIWNVIGFCFGVFIFWLCQVLVVAYGILFIYFSFKLFFLGFFFFLSCVMWDLFP